MTYSILLRLKIFHFSETRNAQYEDHRGIYAQQLIKTNRHQEDYYNRELCFVLDKLENIEEEGSRVERSESSGEILARWLDSSSLAVAGWQVSRWGRKRSSS